MGPWDGLNRRRFPRIKYPCLVVIRNGDNKQEMILAHTENIGVGGVCVVLKNSLKMFCPVELEIDLMDLGNHIQCAGKVVWCVQRGMDAEDKPLFYDTGIEFQNLNQYDTQRLSEIVQHLAKTHETEDWR